MTTEAGGVRFSWDWEAMPGVRAPEHRTTWSRMEIWVDDQCITLAEDVATESTSRSLYCPLYPLAEWIAFNWWLLRADSRPMSALRGTNRRPAVPLRRGADWRGHNLRSIGDGFAWPDLTIVPAGAVSRIVWRRDSRSPIHGAVRFVADGEAWVRSASLQASLAGLVEAVLARLDESGCHGTPLADEWAGITAVDRDEETFCLAAARLGCDPYELDPGLSDAIMQVGEHLDSALAEDFFDAASTLSLSEAVQWVTDAAMRVEESRASATQLSGLRWEASRHQVTDGQPPWHVGYESATALRKRLSLSATQPINVERMVSSSLLKAPDAAFEGLGGLSSGGAPAVVLGRDVGLTGKRFLLARAIWHVLAAERPATVLLTTAYTARQQAGRAFAAELLAPAAGIAEMAEGGVWTLQVEDVDQIAARFKVSPVIIERQIESQLAA